MTSVSPFQFQNQYEIRTLTNDNGEIWFVASDVAEALGYSEAKDMTRNLDDDEKGRQIVPTLGGDQEMTVINEPGLYSAILKSRKPEAKAFKKWVTSEVLPSIRKTGSYAVQKPQNLPIPNLKPVEPNALPSSLIEEINRFARDQAFDWYAQNENLKQQVEDLTKHKETLQTTCHLLLKLAHRMTYQLVGAKHLALTEEPEKIGTKYINYDDHLELMRRKFFSYESDDKWLRKLPVRYEVLRGLLKFENAQRLRQMYSLTQEELSQLENVAINATALYQDWLRQKWALDAYLAHELGEKLPEAPDKMTKENYSRLQFLLQEIDPSLMAGADAVMRQVRAAKDRMRQMAADGTLWALPKPL